MNWVTEILVGLFGPMAPPPPRPAGPTASAHNAILPMPIPTRPIGDANARFLETLNAARAAAGLGPLAWNLSLATSAATNNRLQRSRGRCGHFDVQHGASQCAASSPSLAAALGLWLADSPHRAILLLASAHLAGAASDGEYQTVNVY